MKALAAREAEIEAGTRTEGDFCIRGTREAEVKARTGPETLRRKKKMALAYAVADRAFHARAEALRVEWAAARRAQHTEGVGIVVGSGVGSGSGSSTGGGADGETAVTTRAGFACTLPKGAKPHVGPRLEDGIIGHEILVHVAGKAENEQ